MENPYWHDEFKPHLIDRSEIRLLCFEISNIVTASMSRQGEGMETSDEEERPEFSVLDRLCFSLAEAELSKRLLKLALLVRTFDDTMSRSDSADDYMAFRKRIEKESNDFGAVYQGQESVAESIRECSNKIIHAEDVRPVYNTNDERTDPNAMWGMDGTLELEGIQGRTPWSIVIYIYPYLEGILELIRFDE